MKAVVSIYSLIILQLTSFTLCAECETNLSPGMIPISTGNFGILVTVAVAEFLIIIALAGVIIYLERRKSYKITSKPLNDNPEDKRTLKTQTSQEMAMTKLNSFNENGVLTNFPHSKSTSSINSVIPKNNGPDNLKKDSKVYKSIYKPPSQKLILREQMKKICDDALARSQNNGHSSLRDLQELLKNDERSQENQPRANNQAPTLNNPYLHSELEVYETRPSNIPVKVVDEDIYDSPSPSLSKNIIVEDYDSKYLLALTNDDYIQEPDYINVRFHHYKKS